MVEQVWVRPLGCVNIFLNQGALDGMQFWIMIRHDLWAFIIPSDWGVLDENFRVKCLNTDASPGWVKSSSDDLNQLGMEEYGQRALNDTISSYFMWSRGCFCPKQRTNVRIEKKKKTTKKIYLQSSGIKVYWWTYSWSDHTRVVLFILYCYEYLKSSACLLKQLF